MTNDIDVLIVGAGPAGLTLACDLKRRGVDCRIIDKIPEPSVGSKGKGIQPRSLELFDDLGLIDRIFENGSPYPPMSIYKGRAAVAEHVMYPIQEPTAETPYPNIMMQPQWKTETLLRERLGALGGTVEFSTAFESLSEEADQLRIELRQGEHSETVTARYVVGTDGGRGVVRKAVGITLDGETPAIDGILIADVKADGLDRDRWHVWSTSDGRKVTLCPLPATDQFQFAAMVGADEKPELSLAQLQTMLDEATEGSQYTLSDLSWISLFRPNVRMVSQFRKGRVFLAGDAAHIHTPAGAQGMNTSVQDAYNLGWKLAEVLAGGDAALLDTYEEERLPVAAAVLKRSDELYGDVAGGEKMDREPDESQLSVNYRGASLCGPSNPDTRLQPGDRMPGAFLADGTGATVTLFDLFRGPHGSVLFIDCPKTAIPAGSRAIAISTGGTFQGVYKTSSANLTELSGRVVTVRPDGYIRSIGEPAS